MKCDTVLGLNFCHCRFYKGMGWEFASHDFPNVKRFVENAHRHGVRVLAYVQFSTLYYETMLEEIPDLADWAAIDENGKKRTYHGDGYYRWMPCMNAPGFEPYLKKMIRIALNEGGFDGVMLDNAFMSPCHCSRCTALFRGESGAYDPSYRQRRENPLVNGLAGCGSAVCRTGVDTAPIKGTGWTIQVGAPTDGGRRLLEEINKLWQPELSIQAPATVFAEVKRSANTFHVHFLNYAKEPVAQGARIEIRGKHAARAVCTFAAPLENRLSSPVAAKASGEDVDTFELPAFREYALLRIDCPTASESGRPAASTATP